METAIISGRVPLDTKDRANVYIKQAGLSVGDVIRNVWDRISRTGEVPMPMPKDESKQELWKEFMAFCDELGPDPVMATLTKQQMRDMIAERYE